jgi:tRNA-dihydrouridine synthase
MRLGWDESSRNAPQLARIAEGLGVAAITVHGRTRNQFYQGTADWSAVGDTVRATALPVIVNGDIASPDDARRALAASGAAGVMVGRSALGRPWVLGEIASALFGAPAPPVPQGADLCDEIIRYLEDSLAFYGVAHGVRMARKHLAAFVDAAPLGLDPAARRLRRADLCRLETSREIIAAVRGLFCAGDLAVAA